MDLEIDNRVAVVTGASKGMGFAVAKALAVEGVKVFMVARDSQALEDAAEVIRMSGGTAQTLAGDVANPTLPATVLSKVQGLWGSVDILVNNAGGPPMGTFLEQTPATWEAALQTNLLSVVRFCQAVVPSMKTKQWGRIVSITSTVSKEPSPQMVLSATARAGVAAFTKAIAIELASYNISANVLCPGGVLTDRLRNLLQTRSEREGREYEILLRESQASIPAQRFADPNEIADVILFLCSERGGYITGVNLSVDGGLTKGYC